MASGTGFGKTILIGDQFVLRGVPAIVSALPYETEATVEIIDGKGWTLEDNRREVPGYKAKKKEQQIESINHILEIMGIDVQNTAINISHGRQDFWPTSTGHSLELFNVIGRFSHQAPIWCSASHCCRTASRLIQDSNRRTRNKMRGKNGIKCCVDHRRYSTYEVVIVDNTCRPTSTIVPRHPDR